MAFLVTGAICDGVELVGLVKCQPVRPSKIVIVTMGSSSDVESLDDVDGRHYPH